MNALESTEFDDTLEPMTVGAEFDGDERGSDVEAAEEEPSNENVVPLRVSDERANVPVTEVTERFMKAILAKVPLDRIEELHLFSPLRQGTIETGIAVVAARVFVPAPAVVEAADPVESATENVDPIVVDSANEDEMIAIEVAVEDVHINASTDDATVESVNESEIDDNFVLASDTAEMAAFREDDDSPYADEVVASDAVTSDAQLVRPEEVDNGSVAAFIPEPPRVRHTVYTARYRLVIKGPERGRWEIDVVDEADAPLLTVETVVRGVQRRAGEDTATVRYTAAQIARALHIDAPAIQ